MRHTDMHRDTQGRFVPPPRAKGFLDPTPPPIEQLRDALLGVQPPQVTPQTTRGKPYKVNG